MFNNEPAISTYILNLFFITLLSLLIILYYCKNYINFLHGKLNRYLWRYEFKKKWVKDEKIWIKQFNRSYSFNEIILPDEYSLDTKIFTASPCWMKINLFNSTVYAFITQIHTIRNKCHKTASIHHVSWGEKLSEI